MRAITLCLVLGALSCLTNSAHSDEVPEGKIYTYKKENGKTREMEIYFPKDHDPSTESVPGIIMFHGGGWGGGWGSGRLVVRLRATTMLVVL